MTDPDTDRAKSASEDMTIDEAVTRVLSMSEEEFDEHLPTLCRIVGIPAGEEAKIRAARRRSASRRLLADLGLAPVWRDGALHFRMTPAARAAEYRRRRVEGARPIEALAGAYGPPRGGLPWGRA